MSDVRSTMRRVPERIDAVISRDDEALILVDDADQPIGRMSKIDAHRGTGRLHRAFSVFIFDDRDRLLLQRRAAGKRLWPHYWSNSCCSHPRAGEEMTDAIQRRLHEELGLRCPLQFLFKFRYQAQFDDEGAENELCSVFVGRSSAFPDFNRTEIADVRYVAPVALDVEIRRAPHAFTPWFKIEWERMRGALLKAG